jgi:hypothetical protein
VRAVLAAIVLAATTIAGADASIISARADASSAKTGNPRFRVVLRADSHTVKAGAPWRFVVRSYDLANHPIPGTAVVRVRHAGRIVDTVGWFGFKRGIVRRTYRWSPVLKGKYARLEVKVIGPGGTRTLGYGVRVH